MPRGTANNIASTPGLALSARVGSSRWPIKMTTGTPECFATASVACSIGSRTDTVVETSEVVADATCKALPLNVGTVVRFHVSRGPFCALVRGPAVAHTHLAGALWQRSGPH
jgi:hypothetical protein